MGRPMQGMELQMSACGGEGVYVWRLDARMSHRFFFRFRFNFVTFCEGLEAVERLKLWRLCVYWCTLCRLCPYRYSLCRLYPYGIQMVFLFPCEDALVRGNITKKKKRKS